jgi:hypothetical protein
MADKDTIAALMGGLSSGGGVSELATLRNTIAQNDMWRQAAAPILGARFDTSTWSPGTTVGVTAGQAFLGALLNGIGQRSEAAQLEKVAQVLPALYEDPGSVVVPDGVDREAFGILKLGQMAKDEARTVAMQQDQMKRALDVLDAGRTEEAKTTGELKAKGEYYKQSGSEDPENPSVKSAGELAKQLMNNKEVIDFGEIRNRVQVLQKAALDPSSVADLDYVIGIAKILDPTSVVRESEGQTVIDSQSIPASVLGQLNKSLAGGSGIDRTALFALAKRHFDTRASRVNDLADHYATLAKAKRANINDTLDFIRSGTKLKDVVVPGSVLPVPSTISPLMDLAKQFPNTPEGRAAFRKAANGG